MNIPKEVIEKAIEGGWVSEYPQEGTWLANYENYRAALDPTFWQSLGKSLGWDSHMLMWVGTYYDEWQYRAMRFYDLILQGKDTNNFWKEILN